MSTDSHEASALVPAIDMSELEDRLSKLVDAYRGALRAVSRLPWFGRFKTQIIEPTESGEPKITDTKHRRALKIIVRPFVEAHIRAKIDVLIELLGIEAISLEENSEAVNKIDRWIKRLSDTKNALLGWGRYYRLLTKIPLITALLPLAGAFLLQFISSSGGWLRFSVNAAILLFYLYMALAPLVMRYGFRFKRAIFSGGETVPIRFLKPTDDERERWEGVPDVDIYDAENQVFEALHEVKPREFPLDLVFLVTPYVVLFTWLFITYDQIRRMITANDFSVRGLFMPLAFSVAVAVAVYTPIKYYRQRKKEKQN